MGFILELGLLKVGWSILSVLNVRNACFLTEVSWSVMFFMSQAIFSFITMQFQLCSVFFTFSLGTRTHYFGRTILHGGAKVFSLYTWKWTFTFFLLGKFSKRVFIFFCFINSIELLAEALWFSTSSLRITTDSIPEVILWKRKSSVMLLMFTIVIRASKVQYQLQCEMTDVNLFLCAVLK